MKRMIAGAVATLLLAGCTSKSGAIMTVTNQSTTATASSSSAVMTSSGAASSSRVSTEPTTSDTPSVVDLADMLTSVDIDCAGQQMVGDVDCTRNGEPIKVLNAPFADSEALRSKACNEGYVNSGYVVAVGDGFSISANTNATTQQIAAELDLDIETFCPVK